MPAGDSLPVSTADTTQLPSKLRIAREAAGYSLARMASLTHFSKPYLSLVETGRRPISVEIISAYEQVLGVVIGTPQDPVRLTHEWLISEPPVTLHLRSGGRIGTELVNTMAARVVELRHLDDTVGSRDLLPLILAELDHATHLSRQAAYPEKLGKRLFTVVGELSQLAGWVASDAGNYQRAQQLYLSGVAAAESAGDRPLGAQLLSSLSYQIANVGKREDALLLARSAVTGAWGATPLVRALLLERLAWSAARAHDHDLTRRTLDAVDHAYTQRCDEIVEPEWVYWLDRAEIDVMAARCLIELGHPADAEPLLTRALAGYNQAHAREVALYRTWLAEGYAKAGDVDAARAVLNDLATIATHTDSVRLQRRITAVTRLINLRTGNRQR